MYTLKCTYSVGAVPEGHDAKHRAELCTGARRRRKARQTRSAAQDRPTNIELAFYIFNVSRTDTVLSYM